MTIRVNKQQLGAIMAAGEETFPQECCGFLIGESANGRKSVADIVPVANRREAAEAQRRYTISPRDYLETEKLARKRGADIIGFYHSHPNAAARPSLYDIEHAWPAFSYIIVSVIESRADEVTAWVLKSDRSGFVEEEIMVAH